MIPLPQHVSGEFERMRDEMERMMNEFFVAKNPVIGVSEGIWRPPTDVYEKPEGIVILMEIAGMNREDFHVEIHDRQLIIHGVRGDHTPREKIKYLQMEIKYTRFERIIILPMHAEESKVTANYRGGFLEVFIPWRNKEETSKKSIHINLIESE